jgi:starch phosphorylase
LVRKYLEPLAGPGSSVDLLVHLGRRHPDVHDEPFNMTALAIKSSRRTNGVSELHGKTAAGMWDDLQGERFNVGGVTHITNGAHVPTWMGRDVRSLLTERVDPRFDQRLMEIDFLDRVRAIPHREVWEAHCTQKRRLVRILRDRVLKQLARHGRSPAELRALDHLLDPDVLLIGFARRFATYKRADLLLRDFNQLREIVARDDRPVQFVFAGKAHPADRPGQDLIRRICEASSNPELKGRVLFVENYDMRLARSLVQGVDVWLNNPRRPLEASGTSGMKAAFNGGLNCSVLDGWWCEGYDASHGWTIGDAAEDGGDEQHRNHVDAESMYRVLRDEIVPCFYDRDPNGLPAAWIERMKGAIGMLTPRFSASRMVRQYTEELYRLGEVHTVV